ncbi:MAG: hypothetical protein WCR66_13835 [Bacteroidota bacterium]
MKPIIRYPLAVIAGIIIGGFVNIGIIILGGHLIAAPAGVDVTSMQSIKASLSLYEPKHFLMPFLAHALGTFVGAMVAVNIAKTHTRLFAFSIGIIFLAGGITNFFELPNSPVWFIVVDLVLAYLPTAYLAEKISTKN